MNVYTIAAAFAGDCDPSTPGVQTCPSTVDPTVNYTLNLIRAATATTGAFQALGTNGQYWNQTYQFNNSGMQRRRFLTMRFDFNITKNHALEAIIQDQPFRSNVDFLNSVDPAFPGFAN